jgi:acyl-CoA thioesterase-1
MRKLLIICACWGVLDPGAARAATDKSRFVRNLEAGQKQTLVAFGTSLTAVGAWVDQLRTVAGKQFPGLVTVVNGAQGGANSDWGRQSLDEKVLAHRPDTVLIEFSVNDAVAKRKTSVAHARQNLENMIDRILEAGPGTEVILMVMNPAVGHTGAERPYLAEYNQMYRDVAQERGLQLVDHFPAWEQVLREDPRSFVQFMPDAIHPMREGSLHVSAPLVIRSLGLAPGEPAASRDEPMERYLFWGLMDQDKDRQVTAAEFDAYWAGQFVKTDTDGDQALNADELGAVELLQLFDADSDGKVGSAEYIATFRPSFHRHATGPGPSIQRDK